MMNKKKYDYDTQLLTSEKLEEIVSDVTKHCEEQHKKELKLMAEVNTKLRDSISAYRDRIFELRKLVKALAKEIIA